MYNLLRGRHYKSQLRYLLSGTKHSRTGKLPMCRDLVIEKKDLISRQTASG